MPINEHSHSLKEISPITAPNLNRNISVRRKLTIHSIPDTVNTEQDRSLNSLKRIISAHKKLIII